MLEGLRSPNIHTPINIGEFSSIIQHYPTSSYWAGGTYIMSRKGFYPSSTTNDEIIYLGSIEELHRIQRNDRVAEFGSMVTLYELIATGRSILPKILIDNIQSIGGKIATSRISLGGSLATVDFRSSLAGTLSLFDSSCEVKFMKKKRMHSKWYPLLSIYDKTGRLSLPERALISRVRINLTQKNFQKFMSLGSFLYESKDAVAISIAGNPENDNFNDAKIAITYPNMGFIANHDLDNIFSSARFPLEQSESKSIEDAILEVCKQNFSLSALQKLRTRAMIKEIISDLNIKALTYTPLEAQ